MPLISDRVVRRCGARPSRRMPARQVGWIEEFPLHLRDHAMHEAWPDFTAAQLGGDRLQECVATLDRKRPGGGQNSIKLGIGEGERRHGGRPPSCGNRAPAHCLAPSR